MSQTLSHPEIVVGENAEVLRGRADRVEKIDSSIRELAKRMRRIMREANGVGLAAPQIGVPLRIFVAEVNKKFYALVNPEIIRASEEQEEMDEGCLSVPGCYGPVERPAKVTVRGMDLTGKKVKIKAWGLLARVFQHEIDHLNGTLFVDKAKEIVRSA
jgi:peptide deformylase